MTETTFLALLGVVGTIIGAAVGTAGVLLGERSRQAREDRFRFATDKRPLYDAFIREADIVWEALGTRFEDGFTGVAELPGASYHVGLAAMKQLAAASNALEFVAPKSVRSAAAKVVDLGYRVHAGLGDTVVAFVALVEHPDQPAPQNRGEWQALTVEFQEAVKAFKAVARTDLGVPD